MLLWLKYLKELEAAAACGAQPPGGAVDVKTMCEDEEWGNESEAMPTEPRTPSSAGSRGASSGGATPESRGASPAAPPAAADPPPRLRLNPSLATDPALAPRAAPLKREPRSPSPPPTPAPAPAPPSTVARDYLAAAAAAFPGLFPAAAPGYVCKPCGIRYSSLSTLQAHQEHYCSNRRPKPVEPGDSPTDAAGDDSSGDSKTPRPPGKQYACAYCSYSADKKVSLNRHMRMHSASPGGGGGGGGGTPAPAQLPAPSANGDAGDGPPAQDRYCTDCDIRFSSVKTYRAHKTHYCSTRQVVKGAGVGRASSATSGSAPPSPGATPPAAPPPQYALALPTTPILILPIGLLRAASTLPGATLPDPDAPCFLLPNGTFQPLTQALPPPGVDSKPTEADVLKAANRARDRESGGGLPLDLSVRRSPEAPPADDPEKENRLRSATPEQIVCAPSLPGSPASASPSPRRSCSPSPESEPKRRRRGPTPRPISPLPAALAARLAADPPPPAPALSPKVLVKQGVSKCMECNVVFCSHENYRIHKRLYCPARGEERVSPAPAPAEGRAPYRQLICLACGIHFSSLDNLTTHQTYYCAKRETRSPRGGGGGGGGGAGAVPGAEARPAPEGWKCPCCEVVSPTAAAAQRHMEAHAGVRGFRCTICRYRGNTLRGMRTHIRMHFNNKKPADLQEESYIACVVEEESREGGSPGGGGAGAGAGAGERVHRCASCAYSSTYRGNVVRHARLVHAADEPDEESPPPPPAPAPAPAPAITPPDIKKEPLEEPEETPNYCKSCDISFKYVNTYKAHKQFYCTANVTADAAVNNNVPAATPHRVTDTPLL